MGCVKTLSSVIWLFLLSSLVFAKEVEVLAKVDEVTLYPGGATVTQVGEVSIPQGASTLVVRNFPEGVDLSSLRASGAFSTAVTIQSINPLREEGGKVNPAIEALEQELERLLKERRKTEDDLEAARAQLRFIEDFAHAAPEGFSEALAKGESVVESWAKTLEALQLAQVRALNKIRDVNESLSEISEKVGDIKEKITEEKERLSSLKVHVELVSEVAAKGNLQLSYQTRQAGWAPLYDAFLITDQEEPGMEIVQLATVRQMTGVDWQDVRLTLSTTQPARGAAAPDLPPLQVDKRRQMEPGSRATVRLNELAVPSSREATAEGIQKLEEEPGLSPAADMGALAENSGFQVRFIVPERVTLLGNGEEKRLTIARHDIVPELFAVAAPSVHQGAFLNAQFKNETGAPLLGGLISLYRDGAYIGRERFGLLAEAEERNLGFGPDDKVAISYVTEERQVGEQGLISSEKTDTRRFKTTVVNNHERKLRVRIIDRQPFSEEEDIKVQRLATSTRPTEENVDGKRGVLAWSYEYEPGESREIKFDYRITWPADVDVVYRPR